MNELSDLRILANGMAERYKNLYSGNDIELPNEFKKNVNDIWGDEIKYNRFSAIVTTKRENLNIYLPNQWFYIAAFFTELYTELKKYKDVAVSVIDKNRLKELKGKNLSDKELLKIIKVQLNKIFKM